MIPVLLDEMNAAGLPDAQIAVVIALGTHRFMTHDEIREKFGDEVARRRTSAGDAGREALQVADMAEFVAESVAQPVATGRS